MKEYRNTYTIRDVVETLFRRRVLLFSVMGGVMFLALAVTFLTPRLYQSEMKLLVQNSRNNVILSAEKTTTAPFVNDVTESQINSELEIIFSKDVIEPVADPGWNIATASSKYPGEVRAHEKLVKTFQSHLSAEPTRKSNVINVVMTGRTPSEAQSSLQRLAQHYLAEHRTLARPEGASVFFVQEADRYRQQWNDATKALVSFQQQHQITSPVDESASLQKQITGVEDALNILNASQAQLQGRLAGGKTSLTQTPQRQSTSVKTLPQQQTIQQLTTLLVELRNKRTALLTQYRADDRLVTEVNTQIAQTQIALDKASGDTNDERSTDVDPAWQQVRTAYIQDQIKYQAANTERAGLVKQLADLNHKLGELQQLTPQYNLLASRAENLKDNYTLYMQKRDQTQIEDAMDEQKLLNVAIAEQPTLSFTPVRPRPLTNIALGLVTAIFLGLLAVYFAEMSRSTLATPRELETTSQAPVLAAMPFSSTPLATLIHSGEALHSSQEGA